jgi:hypothetical protein
MIRQVGELAQCKDGDAVWKMLIYVKRLKYQIVKIRR